MDDARETEGAPNQSRRQFLRRMAIVGVVGTPVVASFGMGGCFFDDGHGGGGNSGGGWDKTTK